MKCPICTFIKYTYMFIYMKERSLKITYIKHLFPMVDIVNSKVYILDCVMSE